MIFTKKEKQESERILRKLAGRAPAKREQNISLIDDKSYSYNNDDFEGIENNMM